MKTLVKPAEKSALPTKSRASGAGRRVSASRELDEPSLRRLFKDAVRDLLAENPTLLRDALEDAWEDSPAGQEEFSRWMKEADGSPEVSLTEVYALLRGNK